MSAKTILSMFFIVFALALLVLYWFIPLDSTQYSLLRGSESLALDLTAGSPQFYENMRFPSSVISYSIGACTLKKKNDMEAAFDFLEEETILQFYEDNQNPEIRIYCDSTTKIEEGLFIAGEGGPTNITQAGSFNVISGGKILLFRDSSCPTPNVAIHELLHVLGFDHVEDPANILNPVAQCGQRISPATVDSINSLYSIPSYPDLVFEDVRAQMRGKYLDVNASIRNNGLERSSVARVQVYADESVVKEFILNPLDIGHGRAISLTNIWVSQLNVDSLTIRIVSDFDELKKENNEVVLIVK